MEHAVIQSIQIIGLSDIDIPFVDFKITFWANEIICLRCKIDSFTYNHLKQVAFPQHINDPKNGSICLIPLDPLIIPGSSKIEWVLWKTFGKTNRFSFSCSTAYKNLLHSLRSISKIEELASLFPMKDALPKTKSPIRPIWLNIFLISCLIFLLLFFDFQTIDLLPNDPIVLSRENSSTTMSVSVDQKTAPLAEPKKNHNLPQEIIYSVPKGQVALTFDDGPSPLTKETLSVLEEYGVRATFFFVGNRINDFPEVVADAVENGNSVGSHSFSHPDLNKLSTDQKQQQIILSIKALKEFMPKVNLFRPPYESIDGVTKRILAENNLTLVLWNRDPKDWRASSVKEIVDGVLDSDPSGGVYILHENPKTIEALPAIIKELQAKGLKFVTLGQN